MELIVTLIVLIYSAIIHEVSHGWVADRLGDPTARLSGRLTLNPKNHIDPFMSIALPLLLLLAGSPVIFGAAKPVPVDPFNLKEGRKDVALVSLAGPLSNIILAIIASFLIRILITLTGNIQFPSHSIINIFTIFYIFLRIVVQINLLLAIFNLLPIPPLDGSKIFSLILPDKEAAVYLSFGSVGIFILFFLLAFPLGGFSLGSLIFQLLNFSLSLLIP